MITWNTQQHFKEDIWIISRYFTFEVIEFIIYQHFSAGGLLGFYLFLLDFKLQFNFIFFIIIIFFCFSAFCEFQCPFYKNTFVLTFIVGIFYFISVWRGLKSIKLLSVHINFQYRLNSHTNLFIVTYYLFSTIALLILSHLQFHCFFFSLTFFIHLMNMCKWVLSLAVPSFVSNIRSRKSKN